MWLSSCICVKNLHGQSQLSTRPVASLPWATKANMTTAASVPSLHRTSSTSEDQPRPLQGKDPVPTWAISRHASPHQREPRGPSAKCFSSHYRKTLSVLICMWMGLLLCCFFFYSTCSSALPDRQPNGYSNWQVRTHFVKTKMITIKLVSQIRLQINIYSLTADKLRSGWKGRFTCFHFIFVPTNHVAGGGDGWYVIICSVH